MDGRSALFHNPNAAVPISDEMFPSIAHHRHRDGQFRSLVPKFHPYASMTFHFAEKTKMAKAHPFVGIRRCASTGAWPSPQKSRNVCCGDFGIAASFQSFLGKA